AFDRKFSTELKHEQAAAFGSLLFGCSRLRQLDRTTSLFDLLDRRLGSACYVEGNLGLQLAAAQKAHAVLGAADDAGLDQCLGVHRLLGVKLACVDSRLNTSQRNFVEVLAEDVLEAAVRQAPIQRHRATLEAIGRDARTGRLTLDATAAGLAGARADAATNALARLVCAVD